MKTALFIIFAISAMCFVLIGWARGKDAQCDHDYETWTLPTGGTIESCTKCNHRK